MKKNPENLVKIIVPKKENDNKQELLDNLNAISDDDIMKIWEEVKLSHKKIDDTNHEDEVGNVEDFEIVENVDWSNVEINKSKGIIKWKWKNFDFNTFEWGRKFLDKIMETNIKPQQLLKIMAEMGF